MGCHSLNEHDHYELKSRHIRELVIAVECFEKRHFTDICRILIQNWVAHHWNNHSTEVVGQKRRTSWRIAGTSNTISLRSEGTEPSRAYPEESFILCCMLLKCLTNKLNYQRSQLIPRSCSFLLAGSSIFINLFYFLFSCRLLFSLTPFYLLPASVFLLMRP